MICHFPEEVRQDHVISNNCSFCNRESMAFSIHSHEACHASQVSDKNRFSSHPYSWLGLLSFEHRGPEKAHLSSEEI